MKNYWLAVYYYHENDGKESRVVYISAQDKSMANIITILRDNRIDLADETIPTIVHVTEYIYWDIEELTDKAWYAEDVGLDVESAFRESKDELLGLDFDDDFQIRV